MPSPRATTELPARSAFVGLACLAAAALACSQAVSIETSAGARAEIAIRAARILDPRTGEYSRPSVLLVRGGRIVDVVAAARFRPSLTDSVVDLGDLTILPGLIDSHVHLGIGGPIRQNALADLNAGFTTVVDLGAVSQRVLRIRDSINTGLIPGPRVLAAGLWVGVKDGICEFGGIGIAGGPEAFRERVRQNVTAGADVIKLCVSGWARDAYTDPSHTEMPEEILAATIGEAHRLGRLVVGHDLSLAGVRSATKHGIDGLAHAAFLDSAAARELAQRAVFLVPTLASLTAGDTSVVSRALFDAVTLAHRLGVPIVFGTDGGVLPHGRNAEEFVAVARAGMTPLDAIRSATTNAARAWRMSDSIGVIAPGMVADIIAVDGNPLADLTSLSRVRFVMARGKVISVARPTPQRGLTR